jgi:predicted nucleic acid-binding protein
MGVKYLWDTNTVIYYLQGHFKHSAELFVDGLLTRSHPAISAITEVELLCWKTDNAQDLALLHSFIDDIRVFELEKPIKLQTAAIRRTHKVKLPDAIIAATALVHGLTLLTRNVADFKNIPGLPIVNPHTM